MLSLHTNAAALSTQNAMGNTNKALSTSMTRLGTGYRVNSAMDDAAGLQIATRLNAQARGMGVAQKNTQNGISMLQTAEGSMNEINNMLLRMKDLATESANGTSNADDRAALQAEYDALGSEISNILNNTSFAGSSLFVSNKKSGGALGQAQGIKFQVGATAAETVSFKPGNTAGSLTKLLQSLKASSAKIEAEPTDTNLTAAQIEIGRVNASSTFAQLSAEDQAKFDSEAAFYEATAEAIANPSAGQITAARDLDVEGTTFASLSDAAKATFGNSEASFNNAIDASRASVTSAEVDTVRPFTATTYADVVAAAAGGDAGASAVTGRFKSEADYNNAVAKALETPSAAQETVVRNAAYDGMDFTALTAANGPDAALFADDAALTAARNAITKKDQDAIAEAGKQAQAQADAAAAVTQPQGEIITGATDIISVLNDAINAVGTFRSDLGAIANRLEHTYNNLGNMITNTNTAKGRIMDTDFAAESSNMTKSQMLMQVSTAMLKQSNSLSQMVGSLVQ